MGQMQTIRCLNRLRAMRRDHSRESREGRDPEAAEIEPEDFQSPAAKRFGDYPPGFVSSKSVWVATIRDSYQANAFW